MRFIADPQRRRDARAAARSGTLDLKSDAAGEPTVLASGTLRFFVIERAGNLGVRVRDLNNPRRLGFRGLAYFPVSTGWVFNARFVPYEPARHIRIVNILGMVEDDVSPGARGVQARTAASGVSTRCSSSPATSELFIMFADGTSGHETYGGGRFLYIPLPRAAARVALDFNEAYNPPCALNDFATCPLPPPQNRLQLRIEAGEKTLRRRHPRHTAPDSRTATALQGLTLTARGAGRSASTAPDALPPRAGAPRRRKRRAAAPLPRRGTPAACAARAWPARRSPAVGSGKSMNTLAAEAGRGLVWVYNGRNAAAVAGAAPGSRRGSRPCRPASRPRRRSQIERPGEV